MIPLDSFVGQSADGKMVPIIPGGNSIPLTFSNRKEYVERAIEYRLHEMDRQVRWNIWGDALFAFVSKQELSGFYWILAHEFAVLIETIFQSLFRDFSGPALSLLKGSELVAGWIEARLSPSPSEPTFSLLLFLSPVCLHVLLPPNPLSPLQLRWSGYIWMNPETLVLAIPHERLFPLPAAVLLAPAENASPLQTNFSPGP